MPPTSLLEEYQYDDDQTADLLSAIRQWNLAPRLQECITSADTVHSADASNNSPTFDGKGNGTTSSMTISGTELDTFTATSSTLSSSKKGPRTPSRKSNFSSKPSGITCQLLLDTFQTEQEDHNHDENQPQGQQKEDEGEEEKFKSWHNVNNARDRLEMTSPLPDIKRNEVQSVQSLNKNTITQDSNTLILMETSKALGLESDQLHLVLPTVKKLVQVVTQHFPQLEHFVETVTETVLSNSEHEQDKIKPHKKRNMSARRKEMNQVLNILTAEHNMKRLNLTHRDTTHTTPDGQESFQNDSNALNSSSQNEFRHQIQDKLFKPIHLRKQTCAETPIKSNSVRSTSNIDRSKTLKQEWNATDKEIMDEISRLIEFEEKYSKVHGITSLEESSDDDSTLQDLLNADRTSLRRLVLHFAYLFSVKHDDALHKMNELYIFSNEANALIDDLKKALGLPDNCSIHTIARKAVAELHRRKKEYVD